ncbi:MAG TPA: hypothetical protein VLG12_04640 [Candidatus Saccharimonadales bacterium]|nr:hypothetical protein [Candidatus Saccharimonadales bacterium]
MSNQKSRTSEGTLRSVRNDTQVGSFEKKYGVDLGVRSDMKLRNFLSKKGYPSLSRMLRDST